MRSRTSASKISRSEEHTSELQSPCNLVCRLLLEKNAARIRHFSGEVEPVTIVEVREERGPVGPARTVELREEGRTVGVAGADGRRLDFSLRRATPAFVERAPPPPPPLD